MDLKEFVKSYVDLTYPSNREFRWDRLPSDGSKRMFYRLSNDQESFIVMDNPPLDKRVEKENISYVKIGKHLLSKGIPVARIYQHDLDHGWFIMEDLGKKNLQEIALSSDNCMDIYKRVIEILLKIQIDGRQGFDTEWCYHTKQYDRSVMERYESDYFLTYFLKGFLGLREGLSELPHSFTYLSYRASLANNDFFLHRDFQSRNLIIQGDKIGVVDWQGGRLGPLQYDLASLLIDPYVELREDKKLFLYDYYLTALDKRLQGVSQSFSRYYPYLAIQRNLQILGAFSYLGDIKRKKWFLAYIPPAVRSLDRLLKEHDELELKPLAELVRKISRKSFELDKNNKPKEHSKDRKTRGKEDLI